MRNPRDCHIVFIIQLLVLAILGCPSDDHSERFTLGKIATLELSIGPTAIPPDSTTAISTAGLLPGDEAARASLRIINTGDADLTISELTLSSDPPGSIRLAADPESFTPLSPGPYTIVPQDSERGRSSIVAHLIVLRPARTVVGTGTIQILSNSVSGGVSQSVLVYNLRLETNPPKLVVVPETVDFSDVSIGESRQASLAIDNRGGDMLIIDRVRLRGHEDFAVAFGPHNWSSTEADSTLTVEPPIQVAPGQQASAAVQYTAIGPEDASARLTLYSNDPSAPQGSVVELIANAGVPTAPIVELDAPDGAAGPVTCRLVADATDTEPLTYTWYWKLGDGDSFTTFGPTLDEDEVKDCDLVRCWTQVTDGHTVLSSNVAEAILPFGSDCADENVCTDDTCGILGGCAYVNNTASCADSDLCNGTEVCVAGSCGVGVPVDCSGISDACLEKSCNPETGRCDLPRMDGLSCSDSDPCNGAETCEAGVCRSGLAIDCGSVADPCLQKVCNPSTGLCDLPMPDDTSCSDADLCDGSEKCLNGVCHPGLAVDCSGVTEPCLEKVCNPTTGQCDKSRPNNTSCADADLCDGAETCQSGVCQPGTLIDCSEVTNPCIDKVCNPTTGQCDRAKANNTSCADADLCDGSETCQGGLCMASVPVDCSAVSDPCIEKTCNPATGQCNRAKPNNTLCADADLCDGVETCQGGACMPSAPIDCSGVTDPCLEKTCNPATGQCNRPKPNNTACADADLCDGSETCQGGVCKPGVAVNCSGVTDPCLQASCNPLTGQCNRLQPDNTPCADADLCDGSESCQGGACLPGTAVDCSGVTDPCLEASCNLATGRCDKPKPNNTSCSDSDLCDGSETCQGGLCQPGTAVDCSGVTDPCLEKSCNPATGQCNAPKPNNSSCADADLCDGGETCQGGACQPGTAVDCSGVTDPCLETSCNPNTGQCNQPKPNNTSCTDSDLCDGSETCQGGLCQAGTAVDCSGVTDPCFEPSCNPNTGQCDQAKPNNTSCADSDLCDGGETCQSGICQPGTAVDCSGVTDPCLETSCNPATGLCNKPKPNNTSCADADLCDGGETCQSGTCQPGTAVDCSGVTDPCIETSCNPVSGLCNKPRPDNTSCADSDLCDGGETCQSGVCQAGTAVDCSSVTDPCLKTSCNPATGLCNEPKANNTSCADSDPCDGVETCQSGVCQPGTAVDCSGVTDPCLETSCNPASGLCDKPKPNDTPCPDADLCDGTEVCQGGACQPGTAVECSSVSDACLETKCNPATGQCDAPKPNDTPCPDADLCNGTETCQGGACQSNTAVDCSGVTDPCLETTCNPASGLCDAPKPNDTPCPDADLCDGGETCQAGTCQPGTPVDCSGVTAPCIQSACNPATGQCNLEKPDTTPCPDEDLCNGDELCLAGLCQPGSQVDCSASSVCFESECNPDTGACDLPRPDDTPCPDSDLCNGAETCQLGTCIAGVPTDCSGVTYPCVEAVCNSVTGACDLAKPDNTPCGLDDLCEVDRVCVGGVCVGDAINDCSEITDDCLQRNCNPMTGMCDLPVTDGVACADVDACTVGDYCEDGICTPGEPLAGTSTCGCVDPAQLMLYYNFDGNLSDQSGNGRYATAHRVPDGNTRLADFGTGVSGQSVVFDGTYSLNVTDGTPLCPTLSHQRTVTFWLDTGPNGYGAVAGQYGNQVSVDTFEIQYNRSLGWFEVAGNGGNPLIRYNAGNSLAGWHHWAVVFAGGGNDVVLYLDGGEVARGPVALNTSQNDARPVTVGAIAAGTFLRGALDEFRIYGRALQGIEVAQIASQCEPPRNNECGDGTLEIAEECDDGNVMDDDTCSNSCVPQAPCSSGTTSTGTRFIVCADPTNWSNARVRCETLGYEDLASIRSAEENSLLADLAIRIPTALDYYWIGLHDIPSEGQIRWIDGSSPTYTNWDYGEPNNLYLGCPGNEDCMHFFRNPPRSGRWNDAICCAGGVGYACERRP